MALWSHVLVIYVLSPRQAHFIPPGNLTVSHEHGAFDRMIVSEKFAVYTRVFEEEAFVDFFCDFYIALGFDIIILLDVRDSRTSRLKVNVTQSQRVRMYRVRNTGNDLVSEYFHHVVDSGAKVILLSPLAHPLSPLAHHNPSLTYTRPITVYVCKWVLNIDPDEFLVLSAPTIHSYVKHSQERSGTELDAFLFRWVIFENVTPWCLESTTLDRFVQNGVPATSIFHKTLVRVNVVSKLKVHFIDPLPTALPLRIWADAHRISASSLVGTTRSNTPFARGAYSDSALVHVHTRSISDMLKKACRTKLRLKLIGNAAALFDLMRNHAFMGRNSLLNKLIQSVGPKARLPLERARMKFTGGPRNAITRNLSSLTSSNTLLQRGMCKQELERESLQRILAKSNVSFDQYQAFAHAVSIAYKEALDKFHPAPFLGRRLPRALRKFSLKRA